MHIELNFMYRICILNYNIPIQDFKGDLIFFSINLPEMYKRVNKKMQNSTFCS